MSTELDEIKGIIARSEHPEKYADTIRQMEWMEEQNAKLEKANAELRSNLAKADGERALQDTVNALREDVAKIIAQTGEKPLTKEDIMSIKDDSKRLQAIRENLHLFQRNTERREEVIQQKANDDASWYALSRYGITKENIHDMSRADILSLVPSGHARVFALNQIIGK